MSIAHKIDTMKCLIDRGQAYAVRMDQILLALDDYRGSIGHQVGRVARGDGHGPPGSSPRSRSPKRSNGRKVRKNLDDLTECISRLEGRPSRPLGERIDAYHARVKRCASRKEQTLHTLELALELYAEADTDLQNAMKELISLTSESSSENEDAQMPTTKVGTN